MKISIIVPVYNVENFISTCIESILNQDYSNIELILVNDGSNDASGEICDQYSKKDKRVKVYHKENGGQSSARNLGIKMSTGDYIAFLDSDDFWIENKLNDMVKVLEKENPDLLMFKIYSYYESSNTYKPFSKEYKESCFDDKGIKVLSNILEEDYDFGWCPVWYMIKNDVINNNNLVFPQGYLSEDVHYIFKLWNNVETVSYYNDFVYAYRRENENSTTHIASFKFCNDLISMVEANIECFDKYKIDKKLRNLMCLNMQTLISVVLFYFNKYDKKEKNILNKRIKNIRQIYFIDEEYKYLIRKKEKVVSIMIKYLGIYFTGWLWSIKSKIGRKDA